VSKLLFDQNISSRIVRKLKNEFVNSKHVSNCGLNDTEDPDIWEYAKKNKFTIVTFDSDFYEISLIKGSPPKIIWISSGNSPTNLLAKLIVKNKEFIY